MNKYRITVSKPATSYLTYEVEADTKMDALLNYRQGELIEHRIELFDDDVMEDCVSC